MMPGQPLIERARRWTPPKGLERSRPRHVTFTASGWALACLSAALVIGGCVVGIALSVLASSQRAEALRLRERGVETEATITRLWRSRGEETRRFADFEFDAGGRVVEGRQRFSRSAWSALKVGTTIPVRYDPTNPLVYSTPGRDGQP